MATEEKFYIERWKSKRKMQKVFSIYCFFFFCSNFQNVDMPSANNNKSLCVCVNISVAISCFSMAFNNVVNNDIDQHSFDVVTVSNQHPVHFRSYSNWFNIFNAFFIVFLSFPFWLLYLSFILIFCRCTWANFVISVSEIYRTLGMHRTMNGKCKWNYFR